MAFGNSDTQGALWLGQHAASALVFIDLIIQETSPFINGCQILLDRVLDALTSSQRRPARRLCRADPPIFEAR